MSLKSFKLYMFALTSRLEENILNFSPDRFALVFGEETTLKAYCVASSAKFPHQNVHGYHSTFLALSPLDDETTQNAYEHIHFYSLFWKCLESMSGTLLR